MADFQVEALDNAYDALIDNLSDEKFVKIDEIDRDKRSPVKTVITKLKESNLDKVAKAIPVNRRAVLDAILPPKIRGLASVGAFIADHIETDITKDSKKAIDKLEHVTKVIGMDPEKGRLARGVKLFKKRFNIDTEDVIDEKEEAKLIQEDDKTAKLIKSMRVDNAKLFIKQHLARQIEASETQDRLTNVASILTNIDANIASVSGYTNVITNKYQEESLKTRYQQLFVLKELLANTSSNNRVTRKQLSALVYNTSLPDINKQTMMDMGLYKKKSELVNTAYSKLEMYRRILSGKAGNVFGKETDETVDTLKRANLPGVSDNTISDTSSLTFLDTIKQTIRDKIDSTLYGGGKLSYLGNKISAITDATGAFLDKNKKTKGIKGIISRAILNASALSEQLSSQVGSSRFGDNETAIFDGKIYNAINTVIPGFLAKILQSTERIRTGKDVSQEVYVSASKSFQRIDKIESAVKSTTADAVSKIDINKDVDRMMAIIEKRAGELDSDTKSTIRELITETIVANYKSDNPLSNVTDLLKMIESDAFKNIVPDDKKDDVEKVLRDTKGSINARELSAISKSLLQGDESVLRLKRLVRTLVTFYGPGPLAKQGVIDIEGDSYYLNKDFVSEAIRGSISEVGDADITDLDNDDTGPTTAREQMDVFRNEIESAIAGTKESVDTLRENIEEYLKGEDSAIRGVGNYIKDVTDDTQERTEAVTDRIKEEYKNLDTKNRLLEDLKSRYADGLSSMKETLADARIETMKSVTKDMWADVVEKFEGINTKEQLDKLVDNLEDLVGKDKDSIEDLKQALRDKYQVLTDTASEKIEKAREEAIRHVNSDVLDNLVTEFTNKFDKLPTENELKELIDVVKANSKEAIDSSKTSLDNIKALVEQKFDESINLRKEELKEVKSTISKRDKQKVDKADKYSTDGDGFKEGSYKDVIAARKRSRGQRMLDAASRKNKQAREKAKSTTKGILSGILGDAAPFVAGAMHIAGGLLSLLGGGLALTAKLGGLGFKLLGKLGVGRLLGGLLKKIPGAGLVGGMLSNITGLFSNKAIGTAATAASLASNVGGCGCDGIGGLDKRKKGKRKKGAKRVTKKPKGRKGIFRGRGGTLGKIAGVAGIGAMLLPNSLYASAADTVSGAYDSIANPIIERAKQDDEVGRTMTSTYDGVVKTYDEDYLAKKRSEYISPEASVAIAVIDNKTYLSKNMFTKDIYAYVTKYGNKLTQDMIPNLLAGIKGRTTLVMDFVKRFLKLPPDKMLIVLKDLFRTFFYFLSTKVTKEVVKSAIITLFKTFFKIVSKAFVVLNVIDVWIYARMFGNIINELMDDHGISIGVWIYDILDDIGWHKFFEGIDIGKSVTELHDYLDEKPVVGAVVTGIDKVLDATEFSINTIKDVASDAYYNVTGKKKPITAKEASAITKRIRAKDISGSGKSLDKLIKRQTEARNRVDNVAKKTASETYSNPRLSNGGTVGLYTKMVDQTKPIESSKPMVDNLKLSTAIGLSTGDYTSAGLSDNTRFTSEDYGDTGVEPLVLNQHTKSTPKLLIYKKFEGDTVYLPKNPSTKDMVLADKNVTFDGVNKAVYMALAAMARDYRELTGKKLAVNDAYRSYKRQVYMYHTMPRGRAARPGTSTHGFGFAIDLNTPTVYNLDKLGLLNKYGFFKPYNHETWHIEPIGVQFNLPKAKRNPAYVYQRTLDGLGRGGGGESGKRRPRRNQEVARKIFHQGKSVKIVITDHPPSLKEASDISASGGSTVVPEDTSKQVSAGTISSVADTVTTMVKDTSGTGSTSRYQPVRKSNLNADGEPISKPLKRTDLDANGKLIPPSDRHTSLPYKDVGDSGTPRNTMDLSNRPTQLPLPAPAPTVITDPEHKHVLKKQLSKQEESLLALREINRTLIAMGRPSKTEIPIPKRTNTAAEVPEVRVKDNFGLA